MNGISLSLLEKRAFVTRLALARVREILTFPLPRADDVSIAAQEEQRLQLCSAQSALAEARWAEKQLARTGGLTPLAGVIGEIAAFGTVH